MPTLSIWLLLGVWLIGAWLRIYRQARFYQIEEYKSGRYLRWLSQSRRRWQPQRPIIAWGISSALAALMREAPDSFLPVVIVIIGGIFAVWPPPMGEVKKRFVRTSRAMRIVVTGTVAATIVIVGASILLNNLPDISALQLIVSGLIGLIVFLAAPLWLILGNILMTPVDAFLRQRFIAQAKAVLDEVRPTVIGLTGSYGKTTTKNILAHLLNGRYRAYPTPKSYNTTMGVCIAINRDLAQDYSVDYFIAEMGAYVEGEIAEICDLVNPQIGIIIEVGPQHLERFGSLENIAKAKYELIQALPPDGVGVFNWDNPHVRQMYEQGYPQTRLAVSKRLSPEEAKKQGVRFVAANITETLEGLNFAIIDTEAGEEAFIQAPLLGEHNVTNLLLATAVAVHAGMRLAEVAFRARTLQPAESRLVRQVTAQGITIINDAYSANPVGVVGALRVLGLHQQGRRLLITPGMVELGDLHEQENRKLGQVAAQYATDVILVGSKQTQPVAEGLRDAGFPEARLHIVETLQEAVRWYEQNLATGDTVLFLNDLPDTYHN